MTRPSIELEYPVLDCPDPIGLARFYSAVLGWEIVRADEDWVVAKSAAGHALAFQLAPYFTPLDWPAEGVHTHLDFEVTDMDAAQAWVVELGAEVVDDSAEHPGFRVFRDPAGHFFCLCFRTESEHPAGSA
ncbi:VOC family protein [Aldersonia sp. NBC_00410]|uniref:VOC family protein n=1 Tax=Aldersonia sp. NBC_00410 TaxID=2975954 RepID=UPI002251A2A0|nr:VOC family protein [Aldersonia sp. NBC_00410]MCX5045844.1 VOC family protein [Aldersonia sp. NBC_00410]